MSTLMTKKPGFAGWDGTVKSSIGFGMSSDLTLRALKKVRAAAPDAKKLVLRIDRSASKFDA